MGIALVFKRFATNEKYLKKKILALLLAVMPKIVSFLVCTSKQEFKQATKMAYLAYE